jgi:hypothetical protein
MPRGSAAAGAGGLGNGLGLDSQSWVVGSRRQVGLLGVQHGMCGCSMGCVFPGLSRTTRVTRQRETGPG